METRSIFKALDFSVVLVACSIAYLLRFESFGLPLSYFLPAVVLGSSAVLALSITGFYTGRTSYLSLSTIYSLFLGLIISAVMTSSALYLSKTGESFSRIWLVSSTFLSCLFILLTRFAIANFIRVSLGRRGIILIGGNGTADKAAALLNKRLQELKLVARYNALDEYSIRDLKRLLMRVVKDIESQRSEKGGTTSVSEVWITYDIFSRIPHLEIENCLQSDSSVGIVYLPELPDLSSSQQDDIEHVFGIPTINSGFSKRKKMMQALKFVEDQVISWLALFIFSPIMIATAIAIRAETPGPVFYRQVRYGYSGKEFRIWKFRSMHEIESSEQFSQAIKNDSRITSIGRFIRRTSIDELPQLFNVIAGDMSLVGPRPHPVKLNEQHREEIDKYMQRHAVKPGITGLAQVRGHRGETKNSAEMQERVNSDLEYVRDWGLLLDLKIIFLTIAHLVSTDQAY